MIGLKEQSDNTVNISPSRPTSAQRRTPTRDFQTTDTPQNNSGNKGLQKTQMPWILPLDIPMPGLPSQTMKGLHCARRGSVSSADKGPHELRLSRSCQPSLEQPNQRGKPCRRGPWDQRPWNQANHSPRAGEPSTQHGPRREGQGHPGSLYERGFLKSSDPMAWGRAIHMLKCNTLYITWYQSMKIPVSFWTVYARADKNILVDSGATDNFIDPRLIRRLRLGTHNLEQARKIWNIDGTNNKAGLMTNYVDLSIQTGQKQAKMRFLITDLGNEDLILGYPWLANFEPKFSWSKGIIDASYLPIIIWSLDWETQLNWDSISWTISEPISEQERVQIVEDLEDKCSLKTTISNRLA